MDQFWPYVLRSSDSLSGIDWPNSQPDILFGDYLKFLFNFGDWKDKTFERANFAVDSIGHSRIDVTKDGENGHGYELEVRSSL